MNLSHTRKLFLLITLCSIISRNANSQTPVKNYEKEWKRVEDFSKRGLPKSAMEELKKIYILAKKDGSAGSPQDAQVIKAMVYGVSLQNETREDNEVFSIAEVEKELAVTGKREPTASILKSLLAEMYWNYFQQHRWQMYNRTKTTNFKKKISQPGMRKIFIKRSAICTCNPSRKKKPCSNPGCRILMPL